MRLAPIVALLCTAALRPAPAQQPVTPAPVAPAAPAAPAAAPVTTPAAGPRLQPEWRRQEPTLTDDRASSAASQTHTIRYSTLTLVLVVIILVLLIA